MFLIVVQKMDGVTKGIHNYENKINAMDTDLRNLGKFYVIPTAYRILNEKVM